MHTIALGSDFPETPTDEMRENYYISLTSGLIKYVTSDKQYIDISQLMIENVVLSAEFIQNKFIPELKKQLTKVTMPTLTVDESNEHQLIWTSSTATDIYVIV